ncbi:MAG: endolytic transglycosylase MltG, partial [Bacteroidetes bacterium]|nr:endolytic transglycosylase MltG [Bacteroidota bacterium]
MKRILLIVFLLAIAAGGIIGYWAWNKYQKPVVKSDTDFYVKTGTTLNQLRAQLAGQKLIVDEESFDAMAAAIEFETIYPGKYLFKKGWSQWEVVRKLKSATRESVKVTFPSVRHLEVIASRVAPKIEADSASIARALNNKTFLDSLGVSSNIFCHIIPNTYEFYWNTNARQFVERLVAESNKFWNETRRAQAEIIGISPCHVVTIASIVQEEQQLHKSEHKTIAGLYLNRVEAGWKLQADPTLKYIAKDFTIEPNNNHKKIDSPYNTYMYEGIPPGPIIIPDASTIDAVLGRENHKYMYM